MTLNPDSVEGHGFHLQPRGGRWGDFMDLHKHLQPLPVLLYIVVTLAPVQIIVSTCLSEENELIVAYLCIS